MSSKSEFNDCFSRPGFRTQQTVSEIILKTMVLSLMLLYEETVRAFYRTLRHAGSSAEVKRRLQNWAIPKIINDEEQLILADIYYRANNFKKSFKIIKNYYHVKPSAAWRICTSIKKLCDHPQLINDIDNFVSETNLAIEGFSAELIESFTDEINNFKKTKENKDTKMVIITNQFKLALK